MPRSITPWGTVKANIKRLFSVSFLGIFFAGIGIVGQYCQLVTEGVVLKQSIGRKSELCCLVLII